MNPFTEVIGAVDEEAIAELDAAMVELLAEIEGSDTFKKFNREI